MNRSFFSLSLVTVAALSLFACAAPGEEQSVSGTDAIIGGHQSEDGSWAGAAALYMNNSQVCGGTLVAPEWVVSAGHCVVRPTTPTGGITKIVLGRHKLSATADGEEIPVLKAFQHEGFNRSTLDNDISVFQLSRPSTMPVAKIADPAVIAALLADSATTTVVGWGTQAEGASHTSDTLFEVDVPVISNDRCKAFPRYNNLTDNMFCAGLVTGGQDSCQGDSGGPIFAKQGEDVVQVGLVSWGIGCARPNAPGVYTRVTNYLGWLYGKTNGAVGTAPTPPAPPATSSTR